MRFKFVKIFVCLLFLSSCGFKVADYNLDYKIKELNTSGDKKINYILKNKILLNSNSASNKSVELNIKTKRIKSINEKNISNQITKYEIKIETQVSYLNLSTGKNDQFNISKSGFYNVNSRYSETLNNEKSLINLLTNNLSDYILNRLAKEINDL